MKLIPTNEKIEVQDYPYGFRLRTTLYDTMEFNPKKGFRHVTQTVNPKNGKLNKPKKSTYQSILYRYKDENGHIKSLGFNLNGGAKETNRVSNFLKDNFELFTLEERGYFYLTMLANLKISMRGNVIYGGAKFEDVKPLYDDFVDAMVKGIKEPNINHFGLQLDEEKIQATKNPNFKPFK